MAENDDIIGSDSADDLLHHIHISARYQYVFFETPKAGCSTIKATLQRAELGDSKFGRHGEYVHIRKFSPLLSAVQVGSLRGLLEDEKFMKICFVRNPYSRVLSAYLDKIIRNKPQKWSICSALGKQKDEFYDSISFSEFVEALCEIDPVRMDWHWRPQTLHLRTHKIKYDFIGRFENLDRDMLRLGDILGIEMSRFLVRQDSERTSAATQLRKYYTKDLIDSVRRIYADDFDFFDFDPEFNAQSRRKASQRRSLPLVSKTPS